MLKTLMRNQAIWGPCRWLIALLPVLLIGCSTQGASGVYSKDQARADSSLPVSPVGNKPLCTGGGDDFVRKKVHHLGTSGSNGFDFAKNGYTNLVGRLGYTRPMPDDVVSDSAKQLISAAFDTLPSGVQTELCKDIDYVFVDDESDNFNFEGVDGFGWAFWEVTASDISLYPHSSARPIRSFSSSSDQADGRGRYIAVSSKALTNPQTLSKLVDSTIILLPKRPISQLSIDVQGGAGDTAAAAIGTIMMHELGHVLWYQVCIDTASKNASIKDQCNRIRNTSWKTDLSWPPSGIHLEKQDLGAMRKNSRYTGIKDIKDGANTGDFSSFYDLLRINTTAALASTPYWPSLLSAVAPDEDFADTFAILGLSQSGTEIYYNHGTVRRRASTLGQKGILMKALLSSALSPSSLKIR